MELEFENYSYSTTLKMLDSWYDHDTENVNYAHVLLGMNGCNTINDCIKIQVSQVPNLPVLTDKVQRND
jgi:hypothetical protein